MGDDITHLCFGFSKNEIIEDGAFIYCSEMQSLESEGSERVIRFSGPLIK